MLRLSLLAVLGLSAMPAAALTFESCTKSEIAYATAAVDGARDVILRAAARVGDTPEYVRWFGTYRPDYAETVRANLKTIDNALASDDLVMICPNIGGPEGCDMGTFAWVWPDQAFRVRICPAFFNMPTMEGIVATSMAFDTGTREGTIIHEVSHFERAAATADHCYTRTICSGMATTDPAAAIDNADSYQYFAEDVMFAYQAAEAGADN